MKGNRKSKKIGLGLGDDLTTREPWKETPAPDLYLIRTTDDRSGLKLWKRDRSSKGEYSRKGRGRHSKKERKKKSRGTEFHAFHLESESPVPKSPEIQRSSKAGGKETEEQPEPKEKTTKEYEGREKKSESFSSVRRAGHGTTRILQKEKKGWATTEPKDAQTGKTEKQTLAQSVATSSLGLKTGVGRKIRKGSYILTAQPKKSVKTQEFSRDGKFADGRKVQEEL